MTRNPRGKRAPYPRKRGRVLKPHVLASVSGPLLFPSLSGGAGWDAGITGPEEGRTQGVREEQGERSICGNSAGVRNEKETAVPTSPRACQGPRLLCLLPAARWWRVRALMRHTRSTSGCWVRPELPLGGPLDGRAQGGVVCRGASDTLRNSSPPLLSPRETLPFSNARPPSWHIYQ